MIQDIIDEVLESEPRYTLRDSVGNVLNDDVDIALKTPVVEEGTPINRALFRNFQGDLYTTDRYNTITGYETTKVSGSGNYWYSNRYKEIKITNEYTGYPIANMLVSNTETTQGQFSFGSSYYDVGIIELKNPAPLRIKQMKIKGYGASGQSLNPKDFTIYGSNDGVSWKIIYINSTEITDTLTTLTLNSEEFFNYTKFEFTPQTTSGTIVLYALYVSSWEVESRYLSINTPLTSYETDKILKLRCGRFKTHDSDYTEATFTSGSVQPTFSNSNVATNDYGTWGVMASRRPLDASYPAWKAFDKNTSTYYQSLGIFGYSAYLEIFSLETIGAKMWAIKPSSFYVSIGNNYGSARILGYNISSKKWENITNIRTPSDYNSGLTSTLTVTTSSYYSRFRLEFTGFSSSYSQPVIREFRVESGTIRSGVPTEIYADAFEYNTYLNVNNAGNKLITSFMNYNNTYDLYYNGNNWIVANDIVTGTYVGNSTLRNAQQEIILGFKPRLLIVGMQKSGNSMELFVFDGVKLGTNYTNGGFVDSAGYCEITGRGFVAYNGSSNIGDYYGYNYNAVAYRYIAFK